MAAVDHQIPAADLLLREMEQHQAPSGSDSDEDSASYIMRSVTDDTAHDSQLPANVSGKSSTPQTAKAPAPPKTASLSHNAADIKDSSIRNVRASASNRQDADETAEEDLYYQHRRAALKLSKSWRKKLHGAANAFAASQHSGEPVYMCSLCEVSFWPRTCLRCHD